MRKFMSKSITWGGLTKFYVISWIISCIISAGYVIHLLQPAWWKKIKNLPGSIFHKKEVE